MSEIEPQSIASSDLVHTIPGDLPAKACHWPACADPVCERNEAGTCPLSDDLMVECRACGAACAYGRACAACAARSDAGEAAANGFYEYPDSAMGEPPYPPVAEPTPRTQKRSVRSVLIVSDDATVIRHTQLRGLLEVAGNMKTLGEAIGVDPSTISRALAGSSETLDRDERIRAVRELLRGDA